MIQDEKGALFDHGEEGIGEEQGKLAPQATADHNDSDDELKSVGCDPQVMPQE